MQKNLEWNSMVWIRLPTNQGLKLEYKPPQTSPNKASESDFQQIKDWNGAQWWWYRRTRRGLNPTSNKSRIETTLIHRYISTRQVVWIRLPTNQGLKLSSPTNQRGELLAVWIRLPTNQGLKQFRTISFFGGNSVWIRLPTNQGLKPDKYNATNAALHCVWIRLPTNQGLKPK